MNHRYICTSVHRFRFREKYSQSIGLISPPLATPQGIKPFLVKFHIVQANIPPLLSIGILDQEKLVADTVFSQLPTLLAKDLENGAFYLYR